MKFLLDQNIERRLAAFLRTGGHDITIIGVNFPAGLLDHEILAIAYQEQRILLTNDRSDFGELIFRFHSSHSGVILFRHMRSGDILTKQQRLAYVLEEYTDQLHHFLVITEHRIRVRKDETQKAA